MTFLDPIEESAVTILILMPGFLWYNDFIVFETVAVVYLAFITLFTALRPFQTEDDSE